MIKAFEIAGYKEDVIISKFGALYNAFHYGAPPHSGIAPGIDRMIMLLLGETNIREVIAFPKNANAYDQMLKAPSSVNKEDLDELNISLKE